jgi:hypothetical protein
MRTMKITRSLPLPSPLPALALMFQLALMLGLLLLGLGVAATPASGRQTYRPATNETALNRLAGELRARVETWHTPRYQELQLRATGPQGFLNGDESVALVGVERGRPRFLITNNLIAAQTVSTDELWPGGDSGLDLDGANVPGQLAIWDAGAVMTSHQEFGGRVTIADGAGSVHYHSTHVAGTMVAAGVMPDAHGMSPAAHLDSYEWSYDDSEMAAAAASGLLVSNHSYGYGTGWTYSSSAQAWYWYGDLTVSSVEDPGFGAYTDDTAAWDEIAYDAPTYLIVKSAGNDRDDDGPSGDLGHYVWDPWAHNWIWSTDPRHADGEDGGYDTISYRGNAKNILTVGAVADVPGGWTSPADVVQSSFSSWGPTDDGRVKPDIVANGVGLKSCYTANDVSYAVFSGTSMSSPNASGSLHLVAQYFRQTHGQPPLAATLKGLAIHTASEAGPDDGPDYMNGWGLLNARAAADLITGDLVYDDHIGELALSQGERDTLLAYSDGLEPIVATICWTDPPGTPPAWSVDPTDLMLVNDLDLRLERVSDGQEFLPWRLDPGCPSCAATRGDNVRDNVEKIEVAAPSAGLYRVIVSHKGSLVGAPQAYSLITSGLGPAIQPPVVSAVGFTQRTDASGLVDITYDLADADSPALTVTIEASSDGGATWNLPVISVTGDVGAGVAPGSGLHAVWDFAADVPAAFLPNVVVRVTAEDGS